MENWLQLNDDDFTFGVNDVKSEIISSNSAAESAKASAQNLKITITAMLAKFKAAILGDRIVKITPEQKTSLQAKEAVIDTLEIACDVFMAACDAYKTEMQS